MRVVTFYSYKGGVGRTLACANFGLYAARTGKKVVLVDMDFEAPGLDAKLKELTTDVAAHGVLDQLCAFGCGQQPPPLTASEVALPDDVTREGGRLHLMPAGDYAHPDYFRKLSALSWEALVADEEGLAFCLDLVRRIEETYQADLLVIDSRTGLTEVGGLATQVLPDTVILLTSMSNECLAGTKRIYERIAQSPIVKRRGEGRTEVELRVVVARIPRPDNLPKLEKAVRRRLGLDLPRLYYLFDQSDLSVGDYLAMDRFSPEPPAILADYVELFASLEPEANRTFIDKRLEAFRSGLTRRSPERNEQLISELRLLFPLPEVLLEAARYYRLIRHTERALSCYLSYLRQREHDEQVLGELAEICEQAPTGVLSMRAGVVEQLRKHGVEKMNPQLLMRYVDLLAEDDEERQRIVDLISGEESRLSVKGYRSVLFELLRSLGQWAKILELAEPDGDIDPSSLLALAEAHAAVGNLLEMRRILSSYRPRSPEDRLQVLRVLYRAMPEAPHQEILDALAELPFFDLSRIKYMVRYQEYPDNRKDSDFAMWLRRLEGLASRQRL